MIDLLAVFGTPEIVVRHVDETKPPSEMTCKVCGRLMLPEVEHLDLTVQGRSGATWRCWPCWREVVVTWRVETAG